MPLPTNAHSLEWPPREWAPQQQAIETDRAWYTGNPEQLNALYTRAATPQKWRERVKFWAKNRDPQTSDEKPIHFPAAAAIAQTAAGLLFGDDVPFAITIPNPDDDAGIAATQARLDELAEDDGWRAKLVEGAEIASGLGGIYLRPYWNPDLAPHPILTVIHQDHAIPRFVAGVLVEVTFWKIVETAADGTIWRHLELHTPGLVEHGLYRGNARHLGERKDLGDHAETAGIGADPRGFINIKALAGIETVLAEYVPNWRPNRRTPESPVGCADTATYASLMDALDQTYTSWMRDIELGKRRIIVPDQFLDRRGPGQGATFDTDRSVFSPLSIDPQHAEKAGIEVVDFAIRAADHDATIGSMFGTLASASGYSPQSFGLQGDGAEITATEVDAKEGQSDRTTGRKKEYWRPGVAAAAFKMLALDRAVFRSAVEEMRPQVSWPEDDEVSMRETASTLNLLQLAGAMSTQEKVRMLHQEWTDEQVQAEVDLIREEQGTVVADPTGGFS